MTHGSGNPFARTAGAASALALTLPGNASDCKASTSSAVEDSLGAKLLISQ